MKELADLTAAATHAISEVLTTAQRESAAAVSAMKEGIQSVEDGARLGEAAATALHNIFESSNEATSVIRTIAGGTVEQIGGTRQMAASIQWIGGSIETIATAAVEQVSRSGQLAAAMRRIEAVVARAKAVEAGPDRTGGAAVLAAIGVEIDRLLAHELQQAARARIAIQAIEAARAVAGQPARARDEIEQAAASLARALGRLDPLLARELDGGESRPGRAAIDPRTNPMPA
jgi:methyl-accepting chemotaxis protein